MNSKYGYKMGAQVLPRLLSIRKGTILAVLASLFFVIVLSIWLFFSSLGWFVNQLPGIVGNAQHVVDSAVPQGLQFAGMAGLPTDEIQNGLGQLTSVVMEQLPILQHLPIIQQSLGDNVAPTSSVPSPNLIDADGVPMESSQSPDD